MKVLDENILGFSPKNEYFIFKNGEVYNNTKKFYYKHDTCNSKGYHRVTIERHKFLIHRLVAIAFIPNPDNKPEVNHKDCNVDNNNVYNLEWVTRLENNNHTPTYEKRVKSVKRGEECNFSKLTYKDVVKIKNMIYSGLSNKEIALNFNVTPKTIRNIKNNKTWKSSSKHA